MGVLVDAFFKSNKRNLELALRELGSDPDHCQTTPDGADAGERMAHTDDGAVTIEVEAPTR
ncbi:MAG: hypothetical protein V5A62_07660 [Haloarculaceae archaeon]